MPSSAVGRGRIEGPDQTSRADGIFPQFPNGDPDVKRNAHFIHGTVVVLRLMVSKMGEALACSHQALLQAVHRSAEEGLLVSDNSPHPQTRFPSRFRWIDTSKASDSVQIRAHRMPKAFRCLRALREPAVPTDLISSASDAAWFCTFSTSALDIGGSSTRAAIAGAPATTPTRMACASPSIFLTFCLKRYRGFSRPWRRRCNDSKDCASTTSGDDAFARTLGLSQGDDWTRMYGSLGSAESERGVERSTPDPWALIGWA
eukprot:CAMPEP_0170184658 /NCGR_PEP_ID=MMETSP0040_2-20121228/34284_1 /TAXON_ID=641309 /ORGANISM="Lotharella oceanica, Strain CCMP622" /LENGTH=258 /DNA_ID=CAMNT_0010430795 /DNA_START=339 /DNA_END=1116 /DNA_ORIENTATION=-